MQPDLSIVIPVLNEEKNIYQLYLQLKTVLKTFPLTSEIIFVDDGSKDNTANIAARISLTDKTARLIELRAHFGKSDALSAGFREAQGKVIITIDGDLQDDPQEIPRFVDKINQGFDLVSGWKYERKDSLSKTLPSKLFNSLVRIITGIRIHDTNCGYKAYTRELAKNIKVYGELHRYIPVLAHWKGYKIGEIKVDHHPRKHGKSKYGFSRMLKGFIDLITVAYLTTYMEKPLHLFGLAGGILFAGGFASGIYLTYLWLIDVIIWNRPLLMLSVLLLVLGVQFFFTGLLAEMIVSFNKKNDEEIDKKIKN